MALPADCVLLPVSGGALLVSPSLATFCPIDVADVSVVREVLASRSALPTHLGPLLEVHGFFGPPRPARDEPPTVQLQLTNACNLACTYCCTGSGRAREAELSIGEWRAVVDGAVDAFGAGLRIGLLGGEPLLVPGALGLAEHVLDRGASLVVFTNGIGLADVAERAARLSLRGAELRVSLAGATAWTCDARSLAPRFERVLEGLARLGSFGGSATLDLMLFPGDVGEVAVQLPTLRTRLPTGTRLAFGLAFQGGRELGANVWRSRRELEAALDRIALEAGEAIAARIRSPLAYRRDACGCALGRHLHVRSDGTLFGCFRMEEPIGRLEDGLVSTLARLREHPRRASTTPICCDCPLVTLCGGGCRSDNVLFTGDGDTPLCGPWRVRVLSELLFADEVSALEWSTLHLAEEARRRGVDAPDTTRTRHPSLHVR